MCPSVGLRADGGKQVGRRAFGAACRGLCTAEGLLDSVRGRALPDTRTAAGTDAWALPHVFDRL